MASKIPSLSLRFFGHPGLLKAAIPLKITQLQTPAIQNMFDHFLEYMEEINASSLSAVQVGLPYRFFAMNAIFYEDFQENKSEFEQIFLQDPKNDSEAKENLDAVNGYLEQLENKLNNNIPYNQDMTEMDNLVGISEEKITEYAQQIRKKSQVIVVNPQWEPWDLDQRLFEHDHRQGKWASLSSMHHTLLFGCNGIRTSTNYETCSSYPSMLIKKKRVNRIRASFYDRNGEKRICYLKSNDSRLFQHECEHLDGILLHENVNWDRDNIDNILSAEEFERRQYVLKPELERLVNALGVEEQEKLYQYYDPLHPPTDEKLLEILTQLMEDKKDKMQKIEGHIHTDHINLKN